MISFILKLRSAVGLGVCCNPFLECGRYFVIRFYLEEHKLSDTDRFIVDVFHLQYISRAISIFNFVIVAIG
jgi:hypothetical protein